MLWVTLLTVPPNTPDVQRRGSLILTPKHNPSPATRPRRSEARLSDSEALYVREVNVSEVNMREVKVRKEWS